MKFRIPLRISSSSIGVRSGHARAGDPGRPPYRRFNEGFKTTDLMTAKALLDTLR